MSESGLFGFLDAKLEPLSRRERLILAVTFMVAVYAAFDFLLIQPVLAEREAVIDSIRRVSVDIADIQRKTEEVGLSAVRDPNQEKQERRRRLQARLRDLDLELERYSSSLVPPRQMLPLLRRMLEQRSDLKILRIENLAPQPVIPVREGAEGGAEAAPLYRHVLQVEFSGGYLETLAFLRAIEALPWRIFWESLEYRVERHPSARVRLNIATLSLREDWIGV